jgi:hypothetical protein
MTEYMTQMLLGCSIIRPPAGQSGISMSALSSISKTCPKGALIDSNLALLFNAVMVIGLPDDLNKLRDYTQTPEFKATLSAHLPSDVAPELKCWVEDGEKGESSKAMFFHLSGLPPDASSKASWRVHPVDAESFRKCLLLLEAAPMLVERLPKMALVTQPWMAIVNNWQAISDSLVSECPSWRESAESARQTSELIHQVTRLKNAPAA